MTTKGWTQQIGENDATTFAKKDPLVIRVDPRGDAVVISRAEIRKEDGVKQAAINIYEETEKWIAANTLGSKASVINAMLTFCMTYLEENNLTLRVENREK